MDTSMNDVGVANALAADMVLVLSSELVCQIAEKYFNAQMLRKSMQVKVIDLQPTANGLVQFSVAFVVEPPLAIAEPVIPAQALQRHANGKFKSSMSRSDKAAKENEL